GAQKLFVGGSILHEFIPVLVGQAGLLETVGAKPVFEPLQLQDAAALEEVLGRIHLGEVVENVAAIARAVPAGLLLRLGCLILGVLGIIRLGLALRLTLGIASLGLGGLAGAHAFAFVLLVPLIFALVLLGLGVEVLGVAAKLVEDVPGRLTDLFVLGFVGEA